MMLVVERLGFFLLWWCSLIINTQKAAQFNCTTKRAWTLTMMPLDRCWKCLRRLECDFRYWARTLNHIIVTLYDKASDNIDWHSDKVGDMRNGAYIFDLSLGCTRELQVSAMQFIDVSILLF